MKTTNAAVYVASLLRQEIVSGQLPGGAPLRENEIADRLGVSRTPVREAMGSLIGEGVLIKRDNRTAHVFRPSLAELIEIYDMRIPLESMAARLACADPSRAFLAELETLGQTLSAAERGMEWSLKHEAFHSCLTSGAGRPRLESIVRTLRAQSEPYVRLAVASGRQFRQNADADHARIVVLAKAREARTVERLVKAHLSRTIRHVSGLLSRQAPRDATPGVQLTPTAQLAGRSSARRRRIPD
jgi:DNA-binding GntR family transcriptional regulator